MHFAIKFTNLNYAGFSGLKKEIIFHPVKLSPSSAMFGENAYLGNTSENEKCFLFEYHDGLEIRASFLIFSEGKSVFYHVTPDISQQSVQTLIRGTITKFCLQEQGHFCLHASAICVNDQVVLFIGQKGAGKSTLAAYFHLQGHAVWGDDYAMLHQERNSFWVSQGETSLKINQSIAATLPISPTNLTPVFELPANWKWISESDMITQKYYFCRETSPVDVVPRRIAAVFFIQPRVQEPDKVVTTIKRTTALSILMSEILLPELNSKQYVKTYFESATTFLEVVPSYNIQAPDNIMRIHEVYNSILETISIP